MITDKLTGYFDCRIFSATKPRQEWQVKGENDNITFAVAYDVANLPQEFAELAKFHTDKNGNQKAFVKFKIGKLAKWYNEFAELVPKPENAELDNGAYNVRIEYKVLTGDPTKMQASGAWVNCIQFQKVAVNPFTAWAEKEIENVPRGTIQEQAPTPTPTPTPTTENVPRGTMEADLFGGDDCPF